MIILDACIRHARRDRDFGRVEAIAELVVKTRAGQPPRRLTLRTNVPARGDAPLRERLLEDARLLVQALPVTRTAQPMPHAA